MSVICNARERLIVCEGSGAKHCLRMCLGEGRMREYLSVCMCVVKRVISWLCPMHFFLI